MSFIKRLREYFPAWVMVSLAVTLLFWVLSLVAPHNRALADAVNSYIATPIRSFMAALTFIIPISLFELILIILLPLLVFIAVLIIRDRRGLKSRIRTVMAIIGAVGILFSGYLAVMAIPYHTTPISARLELDERAEITPDELYRVTLLVRDEVNKLADKVGRDSNGVSQSNLTLDEISLEVSRAYENVRRDYPFFHNFESRAKPVIFSSLMSDMGITGIYTYFTGEANINTCYPDYDTAFVVAHELAHQRGINRENEANFMAFLVTSSSPNDFIRYSGYLNLYSYLSSALYSTDKEMYRELRAGLAPGAQRDISASSEITRSHMESPLYQLMHNVNDAYLKGNGTEGVVSYGYVVRLAVAYYSK